MKFKDCCAVLGVPRDADDDTLKKAFRRLARKHHPDLSSASDAQARMQDVNEAYEVLRDKERRAAFDRVGQGWQGGQDFRPPPGPAQGFDFGAGSAGFAGSEHSDFFEALFGAARPRRAHRGRRAAGACGPRSRSGWPARRCRAWNCRPIWRPGMKPEPGAPAQAVPFSAIP